MLLAWLQGAFVLVTSEEQLDELRRALTYEHLRTRIGPVQAREFLDNVDVFAVVATELPELSLSPDPADNTILASAVAGEAALVVSGDKQGMADLGEVEGIPIVTATEALARLGIGKP